MNTVLSSMKRLWWREHPHGLCIDMPNTADHAQDVALRDAVAQALARLNPGNRVVLVLRFMADLSEAQVALVLDIPAGTVKSRVSRALAQLSRDPSVLALRTPEEFLQ